MTTIENFATRMQTEARRLSDLVQEIINLSRLQDEDPLKNASVYSISDLVKEAIDGSQLSSQKRKINILFSEEDKGLVLGDRSQLEMALSNLIENAINYSPEGTRVGIVVRKKDWILEISISDRGVGIPEKDLERIFERFYRVDPARSRATRSASTGSPLIIMSNFKVLRMQL